MSGHVRQAVSSDAGALTRTIAAAYAPYAARGIALPDVTGGVAEAIADHLVWVHEAEGGIAGGIFIRRSGDRAHLVNLAVHPDQGGKGIGSGLIRTAVAHLRAEGVRSLDLATHVDMPANVALYAHLGWAETGRDGNRILMSRAL